MEFRIADTFTDSLVRLTGDEQKAVKTTAFDLRLNPANPGMSFHKLDKVKDKNFWSVRVSSHIRIIVHRSEASLLLCYVDHHDKAYDWAERRKLETHPRSGAAQLVEIRETVKEIVVPVYVQTELPLAPAAPAPKPPLFGAMADDDLLRYGVPVEWLADVKAATGDTLLALANHLPAEAAEALLELATGGKPRVAPPVAPASPFEHPDAQRRFRVMTNVEELERALDYASLGTMHLAKGLDFRAVAVMACDDEVIPSQERIETVDDDADLQEVYDTERHLLYVACTRARDHLLVTGVAPVSEFLDDFSDGNGAQRR